MTDTVTLAILSELSLEDMVRFFNDVPGVRQVSRFSDPTTGRSRLALALERAEMKLARLPGVVGQYRIVPVGAATNTRGPGALQRRITVLRRNPKRKGSASHARFALYRRGMTVAEYVAAAEATGVSHRKALKDVYYDRDKGYIGIEE